MEKELLMIASDFSVSPGPRYESQGPDSGEKFYHDKLNGRFANAYRDSKVLTLNLDGTDGYMSSFIDEAIGNLVYDFGGDVVSIFLEVVSDEEPVWKKLIEEQIIPEWTTRRTKKDEPKKKSKKDHSPWFRLVDGNLQQKVWVHSQR